MAPGLFRLRTIPGRIRALAAVVLLALTVMFIVIGVAIQNSRDVLRAIGHDEGPTVVATSDIYLALSDMDAQVTNVLLTDREEGWLCDPAQKNPSCEREHPRYYYDIRRADAQRAALQAARLAEDDPVRLRTVQAVLDGLDQYDQRVQAAMEHARRAEHSVGAPLPDDAITEYRAATTLMTEGLLPKAYDLTLASAAVVDATYQAQRAAVRSGQAEAVVVGVVAIAALAGLHVCLTVPFRRTVSPFLAVAILGTVALTVAGASLLATEADYMRAAKEGGFDPVLTLSRTEAIAKSLDTDRTRYLLDPGNADRYDQTYLEKSQTILYIHDATNLNSYYTMLAQQLQRYDGGSHAVAFGGFYGQEAREANLRGQRQSLDTLLSRYLRYQRNDRDVRRLANDKGRGAAAGAHVDAAQSYLPHRSFRDHDEGLAADVSRHQYVVDHTVMNGERALAPWKWLLPAAILAVAALVVAGAWLRLAEYR